VPKNLSPWRNSISTNQKLLIAILLLWLNIGLGVAWLVRNQSASSDQTYPELTEIAQTEFESFTQLTNYFADLAFDKGAVYAFEILKYADLPTNTDVHLLGHTVGDILYQQKGAEGIKYCTQDFRNACSHTVVIGLFLDYGEDAIPLISEACHQAPGGRGAYTMCFHGLGHGVLAYTGYDMQKAVQLCDKMGTQEYGYREASECVGGTTMEMVSGVHDLDLWQIQLQNYLREDDPHYPCTADFISDRDRHMCITYWTPKLFERAGANLQKPDPKFFAAAFGFCQELENPADRETCHASFGKEFIGLARDRDIRDFGRMSDEQMNTVNQWCALAPNADATKACTVSAVNSLYWGGENPPEVAVRFCASQTDHQLKAACYESVIQGVQYYIGDQTYRQAFCGLVESEFEARCQEVLLDTN
jgi:hypothetical protein